MCFLEFFRTAGPVFRFLSRTCSLSAWAGQLWWGFRAPSEASLLGCIRYLPYGRSICLGGEVKCPEHPTALPYERRTVKWELVFTPSGSCRVVHSDVTRQFTLGNQG